MDTLRGIFPARKVPPKRDFLKENIKRIREIQKSSEISKSAPLKPVHRTSGPNIQATHRTKPKKNSTTIRKCSSEISLKTLESDRKDTSSQTCDTTDDLFLKDVIIRYPSAHSLRKSQISDDEQINSQPRIIEGNSYRGHFTDKDDEHSTRMEDHVSKLSEYLEKGSISNKSISPSPRVQVHSSHSSENDIRANYGKCNSTHSVQTNYYHDDCGDGFNQDSKSMRSSKMDLPSTYKMGEVPKYLQERKELIMRAEKEKEDFDPDCPDGHVVLSERDRIDSLGIAKTKFSHLISELNKMPMTGETLRLRKRKMEIEKELNTLENTIKIFSRAKVYVKLDDYE